MTKIRALESFLTLHRKRILVVFLAALVLGAGGVGWASYQRSRHTRALKASELTEKLFDEWAVAAEKEKQEKASIFLSQAKETARIAPRSLYAQRAFMFEAEYYTKENEKKKALEAYRRAFESDTSSYLAPLLLIPLAFLTEELSGDSEALDLWKRLVNSYGEKSFQFPEALFNMGRIYEKQGATDKALESYRRIKEGGIWRNLAQSRIIALEVLEG